MSPQPSPIRRVPEDGATSLIFGGSSPSRLAIPTALVAEMWAQVEEGVRTCPRGGAEVGGLLVGPKSRNRGVVVDGVVPLSIGYTHGPSFRMSTFDLENMAVLIEAAQVDRSKTVVGFYRSHTRGDETFRQSDREIYEAIEQTHSSFAADFHCYFVLAPVSRLEMVARVSMWNGKDWEAAQYSLRSNPFSVVPAPASSARQGGLPAKKPAANLPETSLVRAVGQTLPERKPPAPEFRPKFSSPPAVVPAPASLVRLGSLPAAELESPSIEASFIPAVGQAIDQLAPAHEPAVPEAGTKPTWRPSKPVIYTAAGVLLLASLIGGFRWIGSSRPVATPNRDAVASAPPLSIGFTANREGPVWKLNWDRGAIDILKPSGAVLDIKEGNTEQQLNLTPADLSSGTIFYTPLGGDLLLSLQLKRDNAPPIEEHIRVLVGASGGPKSAERGPQTVPNPAVQANTSSRDSIAAAEPPKAVSSSSAREPRANVVLSPRGGPNASPATASPSIIRDLPPGLVDTSQPSAVAFAVPVAPVLAPPITAVPAGVRNAPAPEGTVSNTSSVTNAAPSTTAALTRGPAVPAPPGDYIGPKPIQQVRPQAPPNSNASGLEVHVHIEIDAKGKVTKATPAEAKFANPPLFFVAVRAARSWEFEPARLNGRPVASEMDLVFRF